MFHRNNMTYEHARGMRPYLNADKCNPFNSKRMIRRLEIHPSVVPVHTTFLEEQTLRHAWCLPVKAAVEAEIHRNDTNAEEIHALLSADHGQGAFRVNIGTIQVKGGKVAAESDLLVGHVDGHFKRSSDWALGSLYRTQSNSRTCEDLVNSVPV